MSTHTGEPGDALEIESIKVSPDPPKPGHKLTIEAKGKVHNLVDVRLLLLLSSQVMMLTSSAAQEGTYADVTVKLGLIKLLTKRFDVCDELCVPVSLGPVTLSRH